jgi:hypothetical protein
MEHSLRASFLLSALLIHAANAGEQEQPWRPVQGADLSTSFTAR